MALAQRPPLRGMFRRGNVWWIRFTPPGGKQVRFSLETMDADVAISRARAKMRKPLLVESSDFGVQMEKYFAEGAINETLAKNTIYARRYQLREFARVCGLTKASDITPASLEQWIAELREGGMATSSIGINVMHVRAFSTWLVRKGALYENPGRQIRLGKIVKRANTNFVSRDRVRELILAAPDDTIRFVLFCGFHAGLRRMEICEARPEWFRLGVGKKRGSVHVGKTDTFKPKDREERSVPLTAEFEAFLRSYLKSLPGGATYALWPEEPDCAVSCRYRIDFRYRFNTFMDAQKVRCTLHDMRRSFVSNKIAENSTLIFKLAKWTGTNVGTLQKHYGHLLADDDDIESGV